MVLYTLVNQVPEMWEMPPHQYSYMIIFYFYKRKFRIKYILNFLFLYKFINIPSQNNMVLSFEFIQTIIYSLAPLFILFPYIYTLITSILNSFQYEIIIPYLSH